MKRREYPLAGIWYASRQIPNYKVAVLPWHYYLGALPGMVSWPLFLGVVVGIGYALRRRDGLGLSCLLAAAVIVGWMTQYEYKELRLITAILPLFAVLAGIAAGKVILPFLRRRWGARISVAAVGLAVALAFVLNLQQARGVLRATVALGYPAFTEAMTYIRSNTPEDEIVMGSNVAQMAWYSDRPCLRLPGKRDKLIERLHLADWVVLVDFERSQPAIAGELAGVVTNEDLASGAVRIYDSGQFKTILMRAEAFRGRL